MKPSRSVFLAATLFLSIVHPTVGHAQAIPGPCVDGTLPSGALSKICVPTPWNHQLVVFGHGYTAPFPPAAKPVFQNLTLPDGTSLPDLVQLLGFAFATTSYRQTGLAILEGVDDMRELVMAFGASHEVPQRIYVTGVSEGGLVAALLAERSPELFTGALAACGPVGSFQAQIDYFGDFRVLFDYFFPGVLPGSAVNVPTALMANWFSSVTPGVIPYSVTVAATLASNPSKTLELLRVAKAPFDPAKPQTAIATSLGILFYNVFATNDGVAKLGGNPYDNRFRWYFGSSNDLRLNLMVQRFTESAVARAAIRQYETTGALTIPLVAPHTIGDPIIPIWQELLYFFKLNAAARTEFRPLPIARYGHCAFTTNELLAAFQAMLR